MASFWTRRVMGVAIVFAAFLTCTSGLRADRRCARESVSGQEASPLAGYTILVERTEIKWSSKVKTNKKGEYIYIGLAPGELQSHPRGS